MNNNEKMNTINDISKKLIDNARSNMGQMANAITVITSFLLGHYIVEQEQQGQERAKYGSKVIDSLSAYLTKEYGREFSRSNVAGMRQFYMAYKDRENEIIQSEIGQLGQGIKMKFCDWQMRAQYRKSRRIFYIRHMFLSLPDWRTRIFI